MTGMVVGFVLGLVVGWNFLPQPQFVKDLLDKLKAKIGLGS